ncbi:MAG: signal recognition particle-docking protein FtsY [Bacillota bacterium]
MTPPDSKPSLFSRLKQRLGRGGLIPSFAGAPDEAALESLEERLLRADVGVEATKRVMQGLRGKSGTLKDAAALKAALIEELTRLLAPAARPLDVAVAAKPFVLVAMGVNGAGKTTTLGKLAQRFQAGGKSVMLAASDTFRAAAVEQLLVWGERHGVPVTAQSPGADPAAVAHDAFSAAKGRGTDLLLVDTAGRLHTKTQLMDELKKIDRVLAKLSPGAPHERLLMLDAGTGQNALKQIEEFRAAVGVTGLVFTKLDGTAKGGVAVAAVERFHLPIRFLGVGETAGDLVEFDARAFAEALVG